MSEHEQIGLMMTVLSQVAQHEGAEFKINFHDGFWNVDVIVELDDMEYDDFLCSTHESCIHHALFTALREVSDHHEVVLCLSISSLHLKQLRQSGLI